MKIMSIPPYNSLPPAQKEKFKDEVDYVSHQSTDPKEIEDYFDESEYQHTKTMLAAPFRINTAVMTTLAAATTPLGVGRLFNVGMALAAPCGGIEIYQGIKHKDKRMVVDGAFNVAIGASAIVSALSQLGPLTLAPLALVGARELYMAATR